MSVPTSVANTDWRRIGGLGVKAALVLVVIPFILVAVPQLVGASNSYIVLSNSMADEPAPVLEAGDVIFVYDTAPTAIESGDVITFRSGDGPVTTHRVTAVQESGGTIAFETKGDANEEADSGLVHPGQVVGTVGFSIPIIGRAIAFAGTSAGLLALVIVPSALLILSELATIGSQIRNSGDESPLVDGTQNDSGAEDIHE